MTPASATGFSPSQMTRFWLLSVNSLPSSVVMLSPPTARRTMMRQLSSVAISKACIGWPISSMT